MTIQADLEHAHAMLTQILDGIDGAMVALHDANGAGYPSKASGATRSTANPELVKDPTDPTDKGSHIQLTGPEQIMASVVDHIPDRAALDRAQLTAAARWLRSNASEALEILAPYQRPVPKPPVTELPAEGDDLVPADWCRSCWRNNEHHSPVTLRPSGEPYYVGLCRWCGDFRKAHGRAVPIEVLRARHAGRRVTTRMITDSKPVKPTKKPTKQRKKKR